MGNCQWCPSNVMTNNTNISSERESLAVALSGGGSRAMAFHLGCLRALHQAGLLERVTIISSVSGGSVLEFDSLGLN
jgi:predicted acylesterase/phospholipase RssA